MYASIERHLGEGAGEVIVEQRFVVSIPDEILIGPGRGKAAAALLHQRTGGHGFLGRRGAACRVDQPGDKRIAVGHPDEGRAEGCIQPPWKLPDDAVDAGDPEGEAVRLLHHQRQMPGIGRPGGGGEAGAGRELDLADASRVDVLEG